MSAAMAGLDLDHDNWRPLWLFNLYRIAIAAFFLLLALTDIGPAEIGQQEPELFLWAAATYFALSLSGTIVTHLRRPAFRTQVYVQAAIDIVFFTLFIHTSGGVSSGLGMLLMVAIAGTALLHPGRLALFFAALASLALLADHILSELQGVEHSSTYTHTGLLGLVLFGSALLATTLARRASESQALAVRRGIDLANLAELNEHIIERMQSGIIVVDEKGGIRLINEAAWMLLGNPTVNPTGRLEQIAPNLAARHQAWLHQPHNAAKAFQAVGDPNSELRARFTRLGTPAEPATLIALEDAAEINRQLQEEKLASLGRLTASIAHEIRNPLGAISHAAQLLVESPEIIPTDARLVQIINDQSVRMNEIINDILRLSRREPPRLERLQLAPWLERFTEDFCRHHELKPEQVRLNVEPADTAIQVDAGQLHQILWNLYSNAIKYGAESPAQLQLEVDAGESREAPYPRIDVIDHGPGIPPESQAQLFEPFFTTSSTGTGLGLYITRELCENNGAHIEYLSLPTGGSCFRIQFSGPNRTMETG